jgi:phenylacetate-coenzyme A ligase PaaK-like adenylate-forming protein
MRTKLAIGEADLRGWQMGKIRELVPRLIKGSRFYSGRLGGIDVSGLKSYSDMARLPFTFPGDLISNAGDFLCVPRRDVARVTTLATSGTTDAPKRLFFTAGDLSRTIDFFSEAMADILRGGKSAAMMISSETPNSAAALLKQALAKNGAELFILGADGKNGFEEASRAASDADCLIGMPAPMLKLCRLHKNLHPQAVLLTADYVPGAIVRAIQKAWDCEVFTHYGMTETGFGCAAQCHAREAHHIRHSDMLVEIIDPLTGGQSPPGEEGEITITTFAHEATPLLRYRTGDRSDMIGGECRCGGIFPRLGKIRDRGDNVIRIDGGKEITLEQIDEILYELDSALGYHVKISDDATIEFFAEVRENRDRKFLKSAVKKIIGRGARIKFFYDYEAPFSTSAKRRMERNLSRQGD